MLTGSIIGKMKVVIVWLPNKKIQLSERNGAAGIAMKLNYRLCETVLCLLNVSVRKLQSITFEESDRSRSLPLALIHFLASELSIAPIREIARYKLCLSKRQHCYQ